MGGRGLHSIAKLLHRVVVHGCANDPAQAVLQAAEGVVQPAGRSVFAGMPGKQPKDLVCPATGVVLGKRLGGSIAVGLPAGRRESSGQARCLAQDLGQHVVGQSTESFALVRGEVLHEPLELPVLGPLDVELPARQEVKDVPDKGGHHQLRPQPEDLLALVERVVGRQERVGDFLEPGVKASVQAVEHAHLELHAIPPSEGLLQGIPR